jgi:hypothetical protein
MARWFEQFRVDDLDAPNSPSAQATINSFFDYMQALSLFENAGDLSDPKFKAEVAEAWIRSSITIGRLAWNGENAQRVLLGMEALHFRAYERGVQLYGELIGELRTNKQLKAAWSQVLRLHNLAMWAMRAGELERSERLWLQNIELLARVEKANGDKPHNPRDWLEPHFHLAFLRQKLGRSDKEVLSTISEGLSGFEPDKCKSAHGLKFCHCLTLLKSEILEAQFRKKWDREQARKAAKAAAKMAESTGET